MKLYTEEQVRTAHQNGRNGGHNETWYDTNEYIKSLTPIELPSEEQIKHYFSKSNRTPWDIAAINGALVIVEQIKKGRFNKIQGGNK